MWRIGAFQLPELPDRLRYGEERDPHPSYPSYFKRRPTAEEVEFDKAEIATRMAEFQRLAGEQQRREAVRPVRVAVFAAVRRELANHLQSGDGIWVTSNGRAVRLGPPPPDATDYRVVGESSTDGASTSFSLHVGADPEGLQYVWINERHDRGRDERHGPCAPGEAAAQFVGMLTKYTVAPRRRRSLPWRRQA